MILVAYELTPSQIASLDLNYVKGFITETGGKTSHSAIMSKLVGLPAIMGFVKVSVYVLNFMMK